MEVRKAAITILPGLLPPRVSCGIFIQGNCLVYKWSHLMQHLQ